LDVEDSPKPIEFEEISWVTIKLIENENTNENSNYPGTKRESKYYTEE